MGFFTGLKFSMSFCSFLGWSRGKLPSCSKTVSEIYSVALINMFNMFSLWDNISGVKTLTKRIKA